MFYMKKVRPTPCSSNIYSELFCISNSLIFCKTNQKLLIRKKTFLKLPRENRLQTKLATKLGYYLNLPTCVSEMFAHVKASSHLNNTNYNSVDVQTMLQRSCYSERIRRLISYSTFLAPRDIMEITCTVLRVYQNLKKIC